VIYHSTTQGEFTIMTALLRNLRDLPQSFSASSFLSGLIVVIVGCSGPLLIVIQAGNRANLTPEQLSSWVWAILIGCGISSTIMSLYYRQPIISAWSTPGAALLVESLGRFTLNEAVGAYLIAALIVTAVGFTGLFGRVMNLIPQPVVLGVLAGILIKFGFNLFASFPSEPFVVGIMVISFFLLRRFQFKAPTLGALALGLLVAGLEGRVQVESFAPALAIPLFTPPAFSVAALLELALPLALLALVSQNAPGFAVLRNAGYTTPIDGPVIITGLTSLLSAPFGSHGITLAAITAAMVTSPEAHPDSSKRYTAAVSTGLFYIVVGLFGATAVNLFTGVPVALVDALSGLALMGAIISSASGALADPHGREAGIVGMLCAASGMTLFGIGAAFWGLIAGVIVYALMRWRAEKPA
jgi:benzoate membrane transport protein